MRSSTVRTVLLGLLATAVFVTVVVGGALWIVVTTLNAVGI